MNYELKTNQLLINRHAGAFAAPHRRWNHPNRIAALPQLVTGKSDLLRMSGICTSFYHPINVARPAFYYRITIINKCYIAGDSKYLDDGYTIEESGTGNI